MDSKLATGWRLARVAVLIAALGCLLHPACASAETTPVHIKEKLEVDAAGVVTVHMDVKMAAGPYTQMKVANPNLAALLRGRLGASSRTGWRSGTSRAPTTIGASTAHFQWAVRGAVRPTADGRWEVPLFGGDDADLVTTGPDGAVLGWLTETNFGLAIVTARVVPPAGSSDLRLAKGPARVTFRGPATDEDGPAAAPEFMLDVKPQVMSCLAKAIANPRFSDLWVARATVHNGGGRSVADYRVRFRIKDYADVWSEWKAAPRVAPGQDVVDAYFPLFDLPKLAALEGPQQADLEAEYEYTGADGRPVHRVETRRLKLLDRNQALAGGMPEDEIIGWHDRMNYMPYVLSAFVTHDDPVILQVAGWVSGRAGGGATAESDEEALKFMEALYDFMAVNHIAYQTPPVGASEGEMFQHVKYGRDVLRNKAGTCIDLAIFYASVCDAVGLEPEMVITQLPEGGHCFPVIRLPSGRLVPVETTTVGKADFKKSLETSSKVFAEVKAECPYWQVAVRDLQNRGCTSIDLPRLPATALKDWDIVNPPTAAAEDPTPAPARKPTAADLAGKWETVVVTNQGVQVHKVVRMTDKGDMSTLVEDVAAGVILEQEGLRYTCADGVISVFKGGRMIQQGAILWQGADQFVYISGQERLVYTRTGK